MKRTRPGVVHDDVSAKNRIPDVSVIIPSYNHEAFVEDAVYSALNQVGFQCNAPQNPNNQEYLLEVVVVDDASTDGTADRVAAIAEKDPRVRLVRLQKNREKHSRNTSIQHSRGRYIALLNSDDLWHPRKLSTQLVVLEQNPNIGVCFTASDTIDEDGAPVTDSWVNGVFTTTNRSRQMWLKQLVQHGSAMCVSSVVIRREQIDAVGLFDEKLIFTSDLDLWIRIVQHADFWIVPQYLTSMRIIGQSNLSAPTPEKQRKIDTEFRIIQKRYAALSTDQTTKRRQEVVQQAVTWLQKQAVEAQCVVSDIPLAHSKQWSLKDGSLEHKSGRFFAVRGYGWKDDSGGDRTQVLFDQQEIGTLGFLIRPQKNGALKNWFQKKQNNILVQAKAEPGNVNQAQIAPTYQATASNHDRVHGGAAPEHGEYFEPGDSHILYDVAQSEQGTRFYRKRNRDVLARLSLAEPEPIILEAHRWIPVSDLLQIISEDYLLNSDARSVLVCSPWESLVPWKPFTRYRDAWSKACGKSLQSELKTETLTKIATDFDRIRKTAPAVRQISLEDAGVLKNNEWDASAPGTAVRQIHVTVHGREVPEWDQPIFYSPTMGMLDLYCVRVNGSLRFLFQAVVEPGLYGTVELQPSVCMTPGEAAQEPSMLHTPPNSIVRVECLQSEEGGRFLHETNRFRIIDLGELAEDPGEAAQRLTNNPHAYWLTLAEIRKLLNAPLWFTNESRSILSLLLQWL